MSGLIRRFGRGVKRGLEDMERLVEDPIPAIESAAGDIEMAMVGIEETAAAVATGDIGAAVASGVAAAGSMLAAEAALPAIGLAAGVAAVYEWVTSYENGKRKRKRVIIDRASDASRPDPPRRGPFLPGPRRAGPERRRFGPTDTPGSSMPARKMKGGKKRKAGKALKRKIKTKRPVKRKTSSKKKPKKKSTNYTTTIKQEVHGKMTRKNVSYFGFQATAGMEELFKVASDAVLRAVLKRHKISMRRTDEVVPVIASVPAFQKLKLEYRRTAYDTGTQGDPTPSGDFFNLSVGTYESHVSALATELEAKVRNGYYPMAIITYNSSGNIITLNRKVGDAKLNLSVKRMIKLRNITQNDDGGDTTNSLDTNPLQGRLYKFRHDVPRVNSTLYETDPVNWSKFHDRLCTAGVIFGPQRNALGDHDGTLVDPTALMGLDKVLSSPPPGGRVWDNLSSSKKIGLTPGQSATHSMAFKFSGTLRQFLTKFAASGYTAPSIGYCHMFGFEQKFKTDANDIVNVEYDCDDVLKGGCTFVRDDTTPPTVKSLHAHSSTFS
jgi:hypothetical protein